MFPCSFLPLHRDLRRGTKQWKITGLKLCLFRWIGQWYNFFRNSYSNKKVSKAPWTLTFQVAKTSLVLFELFLFLTQMQIKSPFLKPDLMYEEYIELLVVRASFLLRAFSPGCCPIDSPFSPPTPQVSVALEPEWDFRQGGSLALIGIIPCIG